MSQDEKESINESSVDTLSVQGQDAQEEVSHSAEKEEMTYLGLDEEAEDIDSSIEVYGVKELQEAMARLSGQIIVRGELAPQLKIAYLSVSEKTVTELNELAATLFLPFTGGISLREVRAAIREKIAGSFNKEQQTIINDIGIALVLAVYKGYSADFTDTSSITLNLRTVNPQLF